MGLESATFSFVPQQGQSVGSLADILRGFGAEPVLSIHPPFEDFVYRGQGYWIDLRAFAQKDDGCAVLSLRIALCNPAEVRKAFRSLFERIILELPGTLTDLRSKSRWRDASSESLDQLELCLLSQQGAFERDFGKFEAAISGDHVFEAIRQGARATPDAPPSAPRS